MVNRSAMGVGGILGILVLMVLAGLSAAQSGQVPSNLALPSLGVQTAADRAILLEQRNLTVIGAGVVDPDTYILGPGDVLGLEVLGAYSLTAEDVLSADGTVTFPQLGTTPVAGLTLTEARALVAGKMKKVVRRGEVRLLLKSTRSFKAYVVGSVISPGSILAGVVTRVSEAVGAAKGLKYNASYRDIVIRGKDGTERRADLLPFFLAGDFEGNLTLMDGDVVLVSPRTRELWFEGAFLFPGLYDYVEGDELGSLLRWIGVLPQAHRSEVRIQRYRDGEPDEVISVDLGQVLGGSVQVPLQSGDRVLLRGQSEWETSTSVTVKGAVRYPGPVPITLRTTRVSEAIALAGGLLDDALRSRIVLTRSFAPDSVGSPDPTGAQRFVQSLTSQGRRESVVNLDQDPVLEAGDVITVPRRTGWVEVSGRVVNPGLYDHQPGWDPKDYIKAAGGFGKNADKSKSRLSRGNSGDQQFLADASDPAPGDLIFVPEKTGKTFWQTFREVLAVAGQAAALIVVIDSATGGK